MIGPKNNVSGPFYIAAKGQEARIVENDPQLFWEESATAYDDNFIIVRNRTAHLADPQCPHHWKFSVPTIAITAESQYLQRNGPISINGTNCWSS